MWRILILVTILSLGALALGGCNFLQPSPDAKALTAVKEALSGQPGWQVDDLIIKVESLRCTVGGQLGSMVILANLSDALQKLVDEGVITSFENNCEVPDGTNPLMQDYTPPTLAF
jgi:hypothetical protein